MTNQPPPDEPGGQPQYGPPPEYGQPPQYGPPPEYGQPAQYGPPPQYDEPQYGPPPQYGEPAASEPAPYWQPAPQPGYGPDYAQQQPLPLVPPTPPRRRGKLVAPIAAALVLGAGAAITYVAVSDTSSGHGAASPKGAVADFVDDMNSSDLVGMLDSLAPAERTAIADPLIKDLDELKRIHVLSSSADFSHVSGAAVHVSGLQYGPTVVINDHVQIVELTGGTLHLTGTASRLPLSHEFVQQAFPHGLPAGSDSRTLDIAKAVRANGGHPIRVATEKVDGRWYPSVLYTIADNAATAAGLAKPTAADYIPAVGAGSPEDAVRQAITSLLDGDVADAIKVTAPDELAALHDYGGLITRAIGRYHVPFSLDELELTSSPGPDGTTLVLPKSMTFRAGPDAGPVSVTMQGSCVRITGAATGRSERLCPDQIIRSMSQSLAQASGRTLTAAQRRALNDLFAHNLSVGGSGIVTTEHDGKWYVNPVRTVLGATTTVLDGLRGDDVFQLIGLFREFGH